MHLVPDHSSLRIASWLDRTAMIVCDVHYNNNNHDLVQYAPRSILRRQLEAAKGTGYEALAATGQFYTHLVFPFFLHFLILELEYYQYRSSYDTAHKNSK